MKIIGCPYKVPLKSSTGHTSLWLTDFPNYDHRKKKRKLMDLPLAVYFVWQFMVHSMICMSGQHGKYRIRYHFTNNNTAQNLIV